MKTVIALVLPASIALLPNASFAQQNNQGRKAAAAHGWLFDYSKAKTLAAKTGKPLMVVLRCVP